MLLYEHLTWRKKKSSLVCSFYPLIFSGLKAFVFNGGDLPVDAAAKLCIRHL